MKIALHVSNKNNYHKYFILAKLIIKSLLLVKNEELERFPMTYSFLTWTLFESICVVKTSVTNKFNYRTTSTWKIALKIASEVLLQIIASLIVVTKYIITQQKKAIYLYPCLNWHNCHFYTTVVGFIVKKLGSIAFWPLKWNV